MPVPGCDKNQQGLSCSLLFAVGDRGEERRGAGRGATDGADEVDTIIKGGKQRGKQSQEFRLSIPAPFRFAARIFRLRFLLAIKSGIVTISGLKEERKSTTTSSWPANCNRFRWKSQNTGQSARPRLAVPTLTQSVNLV